MVFSRAGQPVLGSQYWAGILGRLGQGLPDTHSVLARKEWRGIKRADLTPPLENGKKKCLEMPNFGPDPHKKTSSDPLGSLDTWIPNPDALTFSTPHTEHRRESSFEDCLTPAPPSCLGCLWWDVQRLPQPVSRALKQSRRTAPLRFSISL